MMKTINNNRGFSVVELLIAMGLSAIILASLVQLYVYCGKAAMWGGQGAQVNRDARLAMMRVVKDFRQAGLIATEDIDGDSNDIHVDVLGQAFADSINENFEEATWNTFVFEGDVDNDSITETIKYYLDGNQLRRYVWQWHGDSTRWEPEIAGRSVGNNVDFVMFSYYDANNTQIPNPPPSPYNTLVLTRQQRAKIRTVKIDLVTKAAKENQQRIHTGTYPDGSSYHDGYSRQHLESTIKCRNL
jgi:prepilin-type N-terminal cleavage/methylation domain-containing protein